MIKYNVLLVLLFFSYIYKYKDVEDYVENFVFVMGIKVWFDSWMLDLYMRREEFIIFDCGWNIQFRMSGMRIYVGQLDFVFVDVRVVLVSICGIMVDVVIKVLLLSYIGDQEFDVVDVLRFMILDNDLWWIDMDDFVELDWILFMELNLDIKILLFVFVLRVMYFWQMDIGGLIDGDLDRMMYFGKELMYFCIMSYDDDFRRVQSQFIWRRLEQIDQQVEIYWCMFGEIELRMVRGDIIIVDLGVEYEILSWYIGVLYGRKVFFEGMLREMMFWVVLCSDEDEELIVMEGDFNCFDYLCGDDLDEFEVMGEFVSDFKNWFVVYNVQFKWNNMLRNIILRYMYQVGQWRGFVYYFFWFVVKFILDLVDEQIKFKIVVMLMGMGKLLDVNGKDWDI